LARSKDQRAILDSLLDLCLGNGMTVQHVDDLSRARDGDSIGDSVGHWVALVFMEMAVVVRVSVRLRIGASNGCGEQRDGEMHRRLFLEDESFERGFGAWYAVWCFSEIVLEGGCRVGEAISALVLSRKWLACGMSVVAFGRARVGSKE
jgi:hypothetical protein